MMSTAGTMTACLTSKAAATAKTINLDPQAEPEIYGAIRRNALLENVVVRADGSVDYADGSKTENTRVSYPLSHIDNIVKPVSRAGHPSKVIFLAADAFGVLPPVSRLTTEQMQYHFLSGFTLEAGGHRAWHYPADADLLRLLWRGVPAASPGPVRQRPGGEDGGIRRRSLAGQHRLERRGQTPVAARYPQHH